MERVEQENRELRVAYTAIKDQLGNLYLLQNQLCTATLKEALETFEKTYTDVDDQTRRAAIGRIKAFVKSLGEDTKLSKITPQMVDEFIDTHSADPSTRITTRPLLSRFFKACKRNHKLAITPFDTGLLKKRRTVRREIVAIKRLGDLKDLIESFEELRWKAWTATACLAGPRLSEQLAIRVDDINLKADPPQMYIDAQKTTSNSVPIEQKYLLPLLKR